MGSRHTTSCSLALLVTLASTGFAGGSGESAVLIVDPSNAESMYVANYYKAARGIPDANVLYMRPGAPSYTQFVAENLPGFFGSLANRGIEDHVDFVIIPPGGSFYISASGFITDSCAAVHRIAIASGYTLAHQADDILGVVPSTTANQFAKFNWSARAFDSSVAWLNGVPSTEPGAQRYYLGAMLGYTGERGNTLVEVLQLIDRSVAADGTQPVGTFYYMETSDFTRSSPRHGFYPAAVQQILGTGGNAEHLLANLPTGNHDCLGVMTGLATPDIDNANLTLLPGAFADQLTSYAGRFDTASQTKMSRWISKGASGTAGTVEEPCNYAGKFPHARMHVTYKKGLTLGGAWFRSMGFAPFQNLLYGDPLTRPFGFAPTVDVPDAPVGPASGQIALTPVAAATAPGAQVEEVELYVDGVLLATQDPGLAFALDTSELAEGWHDLRVLAHDDTLRENTGRWTSSLEVDNSPHAITLQATPAAGDLTQRFDFTTAAMGGSVSEVRLLQNGRVVAATTNAADTLGIHGQNLGAGPVTVVAEVLFITGERARSQPVTLDVSFTSGTPSGAQPVAFGGFTKVVLDEPSVLMELPAAFDDDLASATYTILQPPTQATIAGTQADAYRLLTPLPGAAGGDALTFRVDTPSGSSTVETIFIEYEDPNSCDTPSAYCATAPNSIGPGALMDWAGSLSIAANDFELRVDSAAPSQFGIFYYGPDALQLPFGDGFRCIDGQTFRLPVVTTDVTGTASYAIDYTNPQEPAGEITALSSWRFQFWYRDPAAGGAGFNLSDAIEATFCP
jgi:hypothetical protein